MKDGLEIESKFSVGDTKPVEGKLRSLGAKMIESGLETNIQYKRNGIEKGELLRLRTYGGKTIITHKSKRNVRYKEFKAKKETDVIVDSFKSAKKVLELLGFVKKWVYEKKRQVWVLDGVEVLVDHLPLIGNYVEIEGSPEEIRKTARKLGFDMKNALNTTYKGEYLRWINAKGLPEEDLVFQDDKK